MDEQFVREEMAIGSAAMERLRRSHVAVFGLGGVGSYTAEALARAGVGRLTLIDEDTVSLSNLNRQLCALHSTLGQSKAAVMAQRVPGYQSPLPGAGPVQPLHRGGEGAVFRGTI